MSLPYTITSKSITVLIDGLPKTVQKESPNYEKIYEAIKTQDWDKVKLLSTSLIQSAIIEEPDFKMENDELFVRVDGAWWKTPEALATFVIQSYKDKLSVKPWVEFAKKLSKNTSYRAVNRLFDFLKAGDFPICENGNFIAYKRVRPTFFDVHSNTFDNSPGKTLTMPRNEVDEDDDRTCSRGLHVASFNYACNHFGSTGSDDKLVWVEVDPSDVVAIPRDYNNQKMRTCKYVVKGVCEHTFPERRYSEDVGFYGSSYEDEEEEYGYYEEEYEDYDSDYSTEDEDEEETVEPEYDDEDENW